MTTMVTVAESLPPVFVAVIVYCVETETSVGVPERVPVEVSKERPAESVGDMSHVTTAPPVDDGVVVDIAVPLVRVNELVENAIEGVASLTVMVRVAVSNPPVLVAVMVYVAEELIALGTPVMTPVDVSRLSPVGSEGETDHESTCP